MAFDDSTDLPLADPPLPARDQQAPKPKQPEQWPMPSSIPPGTKARPVPSVPRPEPPTIEIGAVFTHDMVFKEKLIGKQAKLDTKETQKARPEKKETVAPVNKEKAKSESMEPSKAQQPSVASEETEKASQENKEKAAPVSKEEVKGQSMEPIEESKAQQTSVSSDEGQSSKTPDSLPGEYKLFEETALDRNLRETVLAIRAKKAKKCIEKLFESLSAHVLVSDSEKVGFKKVALAMIAYDLSPENQVPVVRRILEGIFEAVGMYPVWTECIRPIDLPAVQTLELHEMTICLVKSLFALGQYPRAVPNGVKAWHDSQQVLQDLGGFLKVVEYCKRYLQA